MDSSIRKIRDIETDERRVYEHALGEKLHENQNVLLLVLNPGVVPDQQTRDAAWDKMQEISRKAAENLERQGITPEEMDAAIDEAIEHVRRRKQS